MTEPGPTGPPTPETDVPLDADPPNTDFPDTDFPDTWDDAPERPGDGSAPLGPSDPAPAMPSQPPL